MTNVTMSTFISFAIIFLYLQLHNSFAWMPDVRPELQTKHDIIISRFWGNTTEYFKILDHDDTTILVGARDAIYNISLVGLQEFSRLEWHSSDADRELCALKGKHEADCHNYIRVFARTNKDQVMLCGTNSYKPRCRHYIVSFNSETNSQHFNLIKDVEALGLCPYSPSHNSTYIYSDGHLYSATVADFSGSDPLIYRENLRTEQYDLKQLNQPDFVGALERNGYIMFFFREISMEYMNCGKAIYSRVGRVCKNDRGGPYTLSKSWTSFLKTRLNCSVPGEYPFYFDEIQAVSDIIETDSLSLIYAVFTTSANAIPGSAVCAFNADDILTAFEGRFKSQKDSQSNWLPIQNEQVPVPRPGQCVDDSRMLPSTSVNFVKNHPLLETTVPSLYGRPLFTKVNLHHRLTTIAIDRQIIALNGEMYNVIYTGTDDGKITKFINIPPLNDSYAKLKTVVISERQVLPIGMAVRQLFVSDRTKTLIVVSDVGLVSVALNHCANIYDCQSCLSLQDPSCAWDLQNRECKSLGRNKFGTKSYIQSLNSTQKAAAALCPKSAVRGSMTSLPNQPAANGDHIVPVTVDEEITDGVSVDQKSQLPEFGTHNNLDDENHRNGLDKKKSSFPTRNGDLSHAYEIADDSKIQLAGKSFYWGFAIIVISLVFFIGIFVGLYVSRRMCKANVFHANHRNQLNTPHPFTPNHRNSGKDVNLLVNSNRFISCNQKKANLDIVGEKDRSHECKNSTENLEKELPCKTSTLTKVKRTYI